MIQNRDITLLVALFTCSTWLLSVRAQPPHHATCQQMGKSDCPRSAPYSAAKLSNDSTFLYVTTTECPPYTNPSWTNPASACVFQTTYVIPMYPRVAKIHIPVGEKMEVFENITYLKEDPKPIMGVMGVLKNGVNIFGVGSPCGYSSKCPQDGGPSMYVDAVESEGHTVDFCGGHPAPTNQYHIHSGTKITTSSTRQACQLPEDTPGKHSELLGWMFDGFGLYGANSNGGKIPTDLDECGGHTHDINGVSVYHYHLPSKFPWTIGCFKGCPLVSNSPRELTFTNDDKYGCR